jgi:hypothetical protein
MFLVSKDKLRIVGVIRNIGQGVGSPDGITLVDASGKVAAEPYAEWLYQIEPGQKSPFFATLYSGDIPADWQSLEVRLKPGLSLLMADKQYTSCQIENLSTLAKEAKTEGKPGLFGIWGQVINSGKQPTDGFRILAAGYDAEGKVVDAGWAPAQPGYLEPETQAAFEVSLTAVRPIADYEVFCEGLATEPRKLGSLEVAEYIMVGPDERGRIRFFGEVVNRGNEPAIEIRVIMALVNAQGQLRALYNTRAEAIALAPGEKLPFELVSYAPGEFWEKPTFQVQGFALDSLSGGYTGIYEDFTVEGLDTLEKPYRTLPGFELKGKVTNMGSSKAKVDIVGVIYDAQGRVADVAHSSIFGLSPGASESVTLRFFVAEEAPSFKVLYGALASKF